MEPPMPPAPPPPAPPPPPAIDHHVKEQPVDHSMTEDDHARAGEQQGEEEEDDGTPKVKECLKYPRNHMKSILGPLGSTIKEIRQNGADVWVKPYEDKIEVFMHGAGEKVDAAKKHVISVAQATEEDDKWKRDDWSSWGNKDDWGRNNKWDRNSGWNNRSDWGDKGDRWERRDENREKRETETMELEASAFGCIVGPGGAKIKEVRQTSGAHVSIDKTDYRVDVKIVGTAEQVASAKNMIQELVAGGGTSKGAATQEVLSFEGTVMGNIIGTGGKRINDVRKQSGADVSVKKIEDRCEVTIAGNYDAVEMAKGMVNTFVEAARHGQHL